MHAETESMGYWVEYQQPGRTIEQNGRVNGIEAAMKIRSRSDIPIVFITGYEEEKLIKRTRSVASTYLIKPFTPKDLESAIIKMEKNIDNPTSFKKLRRQAEERLRDKAGDVSGKALDDAQQLIHELEVHQIELEMQNEELRSTQKKLVESRDEYHELYDFAPVGYFTLDEKALIRQVNLTGADLLGIQRSKLINTKFSHFISPEFQDDFYFHCQRIFENGTQQTCDLKLVKLDGTLFDARLDSIAVKDKVAALQSISNCSH